MNMREFKNLIKKALPPVASQFYNLSILKEINGYNRNINSGGIMIYGLD